MSAEAAGLRDAGWLRAPDCAVAIDREDIDRVMTHIGCFSFFSGSQGPVVYNSILEAKRGRFNACGNGLEIYFGKFRSARSMECVTWSVGFGGRRGIRTPDP